MLADEVLEPICGTCNLYSAGIRKIPGVIEKIPMEKHKGYNVKKGVWHTHTLSEDAEVLIVENQNTSNLNSHLRVYRWNEEPDYRTEMT